MCRRILLSIMVAVTLVIGFHADLGANRRAFFVVCDGDIGVVSIDVRHREKVKDAVEFCLTFWNGVVLDIER